MLKTSEYAGKSDSECPSKAPRDDQCVRELDQSNDKRNYYKRCAGPGCKYETETCYRCPKLKSDSAEVSTLDGGLKCG